MDHPSRARAHNIEYSPSWTGVITKNISYQETDIRGSRYQTRFRANLGQIQMYTRQDKLIAVSSTRHLNL